MHLFLERTYGLDIVYTKTMFSIHHACILDPGSRIPDTHMLRVLDDLCVAGFTFVSIEARGRVVMGRLSGRPSSFLASLPAR